MKDSSFIGVTTQPNKLLPEEVNNRIKKGSLVIALWWNLEPQIRGWLSRGTTFTPPCTAYIFHERQEASLRAYADQIVQQVDGQLHAGILLSMHGIADITHSNVPTYFRNNDILPRLLGLFDDSTVINTDHALARLNPLAFHWLRGEIDWGMDLDDIESLYTLSTESFPRSISEWQDLIDKSIRLDSLPTTTS